MQDLLIRRQVLVDQVARAQRHVRATLPDRIAVLLCGAVLQVRHLVRAVEAHEVPGGLRRRQVDVGAVGGRHGLLEAAGRGRANPRDQVRVLAVRLSDPPPPFELNGATQEGKLVRRAGVRRRGQMQTEGGKLKCVCSVLVWCREGPEGQLQAHLGSCALLASGPPEQMQLAT